MIKELNNMDQLILRLMKQGDPKCPIKLGTRVVKVKEEKGDVHQLGDTGIVVGSKFTLDMSCYLVKFDSDVLDSFVIGDKIERIK